MGWQRLENPKPISDRAAPADGVRFSPRLAGGKGGKQRVRWIRIQVGKDAARKGSFTRTEHKVHILVGEGDERGNLAIVCDDGTGKFKAKKQVDGSYTVAISEGAAVGKFATEFEAFSAPDAKAIPGANSGPAFITFAVPTAFLAA